MKKKEKKRKRVRGGIKGRALLGGGKARVWKEVRTQLKGNARVDLAEI